MLDVDPSKCKRERTWGIKVYVGRYKCKTPTLLNVIIVVIELI